MENRKKHKCKQSDKETSLSIPRGSFCESGLRDLNPWSQLWESRMLPLHQTRMYVTDKSDYS